MMTEKQIHMYWRLWRAACAAKGWRSQDDALRHTVHRDLLGYDVSHRNLSNPDLDYLKYSFILWADPENLEALIFLENAAGNGERRRLLFAIKELMPDAYRRSVCVDLFDCNDLTRLNNEQLELLRNTLSSRRRAKDRETRNKPAAGGQSGAAVGSAPRRYSLRAT